MPARLSAPSADPAAPRLVTHGCRLNALESEAIAATASVAGLRDAVIINSCAVTEAAVADARKAIRRARREAPEATIIATGCAAQLQPQDFAAMPEVDAVFGNAEKLAGAQWAALARERPRNETAPEARLRVNDIMSVRETAGHLIDGYGDRARAFLQVQNGCDHRCTFCIIPFARGRARSTPIDTVVEGARRLVAAGHPEIVLTGVDIASWGVDLDGAPRLGALVAAILDGAPDLFRLRLSSIDGAHVDAELRERLIGDERLAPYLHLSLQAGDDMILKRMRRRHTRDDAIALCADLRAARPGFAFGADLIAGFPTETEEMFANTRAIIADAGLQFVHVFPFSPRESAPAARMPQLRRDTVKARAGVLREEARAARHRFLDTLTGRVEDAVLEAGGRARLGNFAAVKLDAPVGAPGEVARLSLGPRVGDMVVGARA